MPIIESLLDTDAYKFTMCQFIRRYYPNHTAKFAMYNRSKDLILKDKIAENDLRDELDWARSLVLDDADNLIAQSKCAPNLHGWESMEAFQLPDYKLKVGHCGDYYLTFEGLWWQVSMWETLAMAIINELWNGGADATVQGLDRLQRKVDILRAIPDMKIMEFGTRRRWSRRWHSTVVDTLLKKCPENYLGTSNVRNAYLQQVPAMGTMAHELFMAIAGLYDHAPSSLRGSQQILLKQWWDMWGEEKSIALTDTWGSKFFFKDFTETQAREWKGLRQDSGSPYEFADDALKMYHAFQINPQKKIVVFSDGLTIPVMLDLHLKYGKRLNCIYGWGTNLTNDMDVPQPSIVVKMVEIEGNKTVKLSDTAEKHLGPDRKVYDYWNIFRI